MAILLREMLEINNFNSCNMLKFCSYLYGNGLNKSKQFLAAGCLSQSLEYAKAPDDIPRLGGIIVSVYKTYL